MYTGHRFLEDKCTRGITLARHWRTKGAKLARREDGLPRVQLSLSKSQKKKWFENRWFSPRLVSQDKIAQPSGYSMEQAS